MKRVLRKISWFAGSLSVLLAVGLATAGVDRFVIKDHPDGDGNYLTWETAAPDIQLAIDAADAGDTIWVTNGVYDTGGRVFGATITMNRVVIDKAVTVRSVNGPEVTIIHGAWDSSHPRGLGSQAIRGVYMGSGSAVIGMTIMNGATVDETGDQGRGGGILAAGGASGVVISNCVVSGNSSRERGGGLRISDGQVFSTEILGNQTSTYGAAGVTAADSVFYDCTIGFNTNHTSHGGGGVRGGTYYDSTIANNNSGRAGPGGRDAIFVRCAITNNTASGYPGNFNGAIYDSTAYDSLIAYNTIGQGSANRNGGGAQNSTLYRCQLIGNYIGGDGGGADGSTLFDCVVMDNYSHRHGAGVSDSTVYNSLIIGNDGNRRGGGAYMSTLYNTLVVGNAGAYHMAGEAGGGVYGGALFNCTVVGNVTKYATTTGGGVAASVVVNSIVVDNECATYPNYGPSVVFTNSLTYPEQAGWAEGNITNAPIFLAAGSGYGLDHVPGDYQLQSHSPGMNAGIEFDWMTEPQFEGDVRYLDLDGNPRIGLAGIVDMGAYEFVYVLGTIFMMR